MDRQVHAAGDLIPVLGLAIFAKCSPGHKFADARLLAMEFLKIGAMKVPLAAFLAVTMVWSLTGSAQTVEDYETQAVKAYPQLGIQGSAFNQKFLAEVQKAKDSNDDILKSPDWPLKIAKQVAAEMDANPIAPAMDRAQGSFASDVGLQKFVKLTVEQVAQSPFSLRGALVELTGIDHIKVQEVDTGVYEATICGMNIAELKATVTQQQAAVLEGATTLYISVDKPDKDESTVIIHGLHSSYEGLSTMPTVSW